MDKKKIVIFSLLGAILLTVIFIPGYLRIRRLAQQNRELENRIAEIEQANIQLKEEQHKLKSDPLYLEKVARKKLGVAKEGEIVYKVLPPQQKR